MDQKAMFASKTIAEHLGRGFVGIGDCALGLDLAPAHPFVALALVPIALVALRGCPTCWTIGLVQTIAAKMQGKEAPDACTGGRCATKS